MKVLQFGRFWNDQHGGIERHVALLSRELASQGVTGTHHYTDAGAASWYDFAVAIQEEALAAGLLSTAVPVIPIATSDFPTPAKRPSYSVLDKASTFAALGGPTQHWRANLRTMIAQIAEHS